MQKTLILILTIGLISPALATWEQTGPFGGYLRPLVVAPTAGNTVYAASYSSPTTVIKSIDGCASWNNVGTIADYTYCMAIHPTNPNILYAGRYIYVRKSTNGGANWTSYSTGGRYIYGLAVHPTDPSIVCAAGNNYISNIYRMSFFKSTNAGVNWTSVVLNTERSYSYCLAIDPSDPDIIYVGGIYYHPVDSIYYPTIYKSTDCGATFTESASGIPTTITNYVYSLAVHPTNSTIVYAGTYRGIYRSINGGSTWSQVSSYLYNYAMATTPGNPDVVYSGGSSDIYKSTNSGATWSICDNGLTGSYFRGIGIHPTQPSTVYAASNQGCNKTTNGGSNWFPVNTGLSMAIVIGIGVAPSDPSVVYMTSDGIGAFKTTDNCETWTKLPTFSSCGDMCNYAVNNTDPNIVLALEGFG